MVLARVAEYLDPSRHSQQLGRDERPKLPDTGVERPQQNMNDGQDEELEEARPQYLHVRCKAVKHPT